MEKIYCSHCMQPMAEEGECPHCHRGAYEPPLHHMKPGAMLQGRYLIGKALGEGGFGITYLGRDTTLDMPIAVKEYYPNGFSNRNHQVSNEVTLTQNGEQYDFESEMQRFLKEARMLAKFSGEPGVVGVRDFFRENNTAYIVMEYLDGITMKQCLRRGTIPPEKLFALMEPVMESLSRIHEAGLIHRDISPDNIMLLKNGQLKLLDFGAAREVSGDKSLSVLLKPGYAPEEQYRTKGNQGPWTDVYALSATMYKCITGKTPEEALERAYEDNLLPPSKLGIQIDASQEAALMKGLGVRIKDRTQSIRELMEGLRAESQEAPIHHVSVSSGLDIPAAPKDELTVAKAEDLTIREADAGLTVRQPESQPEKPPQHDPVPEGGKKKKLPLILAIAGGVVVLGVVLILLLGGSKGKAPVPVTEIPGDDSYSLEVQGQIQDPGRDLKVEDDSLRLKGENGFAILDHQGRDVTGEVFTDAEYLGNDLFLVRQGAGEVNSGALMTREGEILFSGVSLISWPQEEGGKTHGRFLLTFDAQDRTEDDQNYLVCQTENGRVYSSNVGGTLYTGTIRVYDTQAKAFVPNLPVITDEWSVEVCGNSLLVHLEKGTNLYDCTGKLLMELPDSYPSVSDGIFAYSEGGTYRVCDEQGNQLTYSNNYLGVISGSRYLQCNADGMTRVLDAQGNRVLPQDYDTVNWFGDGMFKVRLGDGYGLVYENGAEFLPCSYDTITSIGRGYGYATRGDVYDLFGPEGIIGVNLPYKATSLNYINDDQEGYVINRRAFALQLNSAYFEEADKGLVIIKGGERNLYGVVDLISGTQLLGYDYEMICSTEGYLYAYKNGVWEIYRINFSQGN